MATYSPIPTHPGTPLTDEPSGAGPLPRGGPATAALRVAVPLLVCVTVVAALAVAMRPQHDRSALDEYLPSSTRVSRLRQHPTGATWQATQYRILASYGFDSLPQKVDRALGYGDDPSAPELQGRWLMVDLQAPKRELRTKALHVGTRRLTLQADLSGATWLTFSPGLPVLGVDLLAGRTTTWTGTATSVSRGEDQSSWQMSARLHTAPSTSSPGCVTTDIDFTLAGGGHSTWTWTWCTGGRGLAGFTSGDQGFEPGTAGAAPTVDLQAHPPRPRLTGSVRELVAFRLTGGVLYEAHLSGPRATAQAGRDLVVASNTTVWSLGPDRVTDTELDRDVGWRAHPGGLITAVTAVGDETVVATTDKQIVAYAANGWVRWRRPTSATVSRLLPAGDEVVALDGPTRLRALDARTGATRWTWTGAEVVDVAAGDHLVVAVEDDRVVALGRTDGRHRWSAAAPDASAVAVTGGTVVTQQGRRLIGRSAADGSLAWGRAATGEANGVWTAGSLVVVADSRETYAIRPDGSSVWRAPGRAQSVAVTAGLVAIAFRGRIEAWSAAGHVTRWTVPQGYGVPLSGRLIVTGAGIVADQMGPDGTSTWWAYT